MTYLDPTEQKVLSYIFKHNKELSDYQLCRYLLYELEPNIVQQCLVRLSTLGFAELKSGKDATLRWTVTEKGFLEIKNSMPLDLLNKIRKTPGLFLGNKSISRLGSFIDGFYCGLNDTGMFDHKEWIEFQYFVNKKYDNKKTMRWDFFLLSVEDDESKAFDHFFTLLDEFFDQKKKAKMS